MAKKIFNTVTGLDISCLAWRFSYNTTLSSFHHGFHLRWCIKEMQKNVSHSLFSNTINILKFSELLIKIIHTDAIHNSVNKKHEIKCLNFSFLICFLIGKVKLFTTSYSRVYLLQLVDAQPLSGFSYGTSKFFVHAPS